MFIATHAAIGALIGEEFASHPVVSFVLAFGAHFLTDLIPHGDTNLYKGYVAGTKVKKAMLIVGADAVLTALFIAYLFAIVVVDHRIAIVAGVIGGVLPDVLVAIYEVTHWKWLAWFHRLHFYFHNLINSRTGDLSLRTGMIMEVLILSGLLYRLI